MSVPDFVHIHNHSSFSKYDGFASVKDIVRKTKSLGMSAVGLTDHGTFAGAIEFLRTCREEGIKPVLGVETYLARNHKCKSKKDEEIKDPKTGEVTKIVHGQTDGRRGNRHLNIIAKNYKGYQNVCTLSHIASTQGFYHDPRVDFELLEKYKEGVIVTSACLSSVINWNLSIDRYKEAKQAVGYFQDIFGEDFYLEIMYHGIPDEAKILPEIQKLSRETGVKVICTNDCHYIEQADAANHEVVLCMSQKRVLRDPNFKRFPYHEFYFKSKDEMYKIFRSVPSFMRNTLEVAEKCDYSEIILGGNMLLPKFDIPKEFSNPYKYLKSLAWDGMKRLEIDKSKPHVDRINLELSDLKLIYDTKGYDFATYFLIVWDTAKWSKKNDISIGIRGSGIGSLLLKCLGLYDDPLDPIEQKLLWSRFLGFDNLKFLSEADFGKKIPRSPKTTI